MNLEIFPYRVPSRQRALSSPEMSSEPQYASNTTGEVTVSELRWNNSGMVIISPANSQTNAPLGSFSRVLSPQPLPLGVKNT